MGYIVNTATFLNANQRVCIIATELGLKVIRSNTRFRFLKQKCC